MVIFVYFKFPALIYWRSKLPANSSVNLFCLCHSQDCLIYPDQSGSLFSVFSICFESIYLSMALLLKVFHVIFSLFVLRTFYSNYETIYKAKQNQTQLTNILTNWKINKECFILCNHGKHSLTNF